MRVWRPGWRRRAAMAMPRRITVAPVIGSRFATPRMPSVPNRDRPLLIAALVARSGILRCRSAPHAFGRNPHADARRHALDAHLDLTRPALVGTELDDRCERDLR